MTWTWFNDAAPRQMQPLAGRLWWSFYESDASFENFVTRALAYVSRRPRAEVQSLTVPEREERLLAILDREPFLVVLDGFERLLVAYAGLDAARLADDELDVRTANTVAVTWAAPWCDAVVRPTPASSDGQRAAVGSFLRKLAGPIGAHPHQHPAVPGGPADGDRSPRGRLLRLHPEGARRRRRAEPVAGVRSRRLARGAAAPVP